MSNSWWSPLALIAFGLLTAGGADRLTERSKSSVRDRWLFAATVAGWTGVWLGWWWLLQTIVDLETATALWLATLTVAARIRDRRRAAQRNALAWMLAAANDQRIDPARATAALATEHQGRTAVRLRGLAVRLGGGAEWGSALEPDRTLLSEAGLAAVHVGAAADARGLVLRETAEWESTRDAASQSLRTKSLHLAAAIAVAWVMTVSLAAYVGKSLHRLVGDTDVRLPASLSWLVDSGRAIAAWHGGHPQLARALPLLAFAPCLVLAWRWRLFDSLVARGSSARSRLPASAVLRLLAVAAEQGKKPVAIVPAFAAAFPLGAWGDRWRRAVDQCAADQPWWRALADQGLIPEADAEQLHSAERRGTLPRALRERANALDRQTIRRLRAWVAVLLTAFLWSLVIGGALAQLAFWLPLLKLSLPA